MQRVFVDTSVLFPFSVMDLLLALTENGIHEVLWTDELLDEWGRVIVREHKRSPESAKSVGDAIRDAFTDLRIDPDSYRHTVATMPGPDPDDLVHSAAAVAANVDALITWDTNGFPATPLSVLGLRVTDPDTYLTELFDGFPDDVTSIVDLARTKSRPPMTATDILDALGRAGLVTFPTRVRERL